MRADCGGDLPRDGTGLFDLDRLLYARMPRGDDDLRELPRRAQPPLEARSAGGSTIVRRLGALPPLVLHVHPVDGWESDYPLSPIGALVLIVDPAGVRAERLHGWPEQVRP